MLGWGELVLILIAAIIFLGPEKLTEFARQLGRLYGEYKKTMKMIELEVLYGYKPPTDEELEEKRKRDLEALMEEIKNLDNKK